VHDGLHEVQRQVPTALGAAAAAAVAGPGDAPASPRPGEEVASFRGQARVVIRSAARAALEVASGWP
jgi:hypothetical protein